VRYDDAAGGDPLQPLGKEEAPVVVPKGHGPYRTPGVVEPELKRSALWELVHLARQMLTQTSERMLIVQGLTALTLEEEACPSKTTDKT